MNEVLEREERFGCKWEGNEKPALLDFSDFGGMARWEKVGLARPELKKIGARPIGHSGDSPA
jgi:hypothetical protein